MADAKISALPASTTPLAGSEILPIVQSGVTKKVSVADLTAGRATSVSTLGVGTASPVAALSNTNATYAGGTAADGLLWRTLQNDWGVVLVASPAAGAGYALRTHTNDATSSSYPLAVSSGAGSGTFKFSVQGDGTTTVTGGNLVIGTAGKGIDFSADSSAAGMTSELLDDYEEGTWTPSVTVNPGTATGYTIANSVYTKIGRQVTVKTEITPTGGSFGNGASDCKIDGMPFVAVGVFAGVAFNSSNYFANDFGFVGTNGTQLIISSDIDIAVGNKISVQITYFV